MKFAPEYVTCVLNENFEDAKAQFLLPLMRIHYAHLVMLAEQGIVAAADAGTIRGALDAVSTDEVRRVTYDGTYEDLFFYVERLIVSAGRGGSRWPAAYRPLPQRHRHDDVPDAAAGAGAGGAGAVAAPAAGAARPRWPRISRTSSPRTRTPSRRSRAPSRTICWRWSSSWSATPCGSRPRSRARTAIRSARARSPAPGFRSIASRTTELLGFDEPTGNTYGSIATVDYLLESVSAAAVLLAGLGRVVQDFLLWCTSEFGYLRLADGFVQCSSIMPQKRNPVALEHARAIASKAVGQAGAILYASTTRRSATSSTPRTICSRSCSSMFKDAIRLVGLVAAAMSTRGVRPRAARPNGRGRAGSPSRSSPTR